MYTIEFFNSLKFPGTPNHELRLKVGLLMMLLRNTNQSQGLCNCTRLIVTHLRNWSVIASIMSGKNGLRVTIPRIVMSPNESRWSYRLRRRQISLTPCFAMTINKSQGQFLNHVGLFLPTQIFTHGPLYDAASKVTSRQGLIILNADDKMNDPQLVKEHSI